MVEFMDMEITAANAQEVADELNAAYRAGELSEVNGRVVQPRVRGGEVARAWQNGTVSVVVKARRPGHYTDVYVKVGSRLRAWTA